MLSACHELYLSTLVLIAQTSFLLKHGQRNRHLNRQAHMEWSSSMPTAAAVQWAWIINVSWHNGIGTGSSQDWTENQSEFITFAVGLCLNSNNFFSITSQLLKSHPHSTNVPVRLKKLVSVRSISRNKTDKIDWTINIINKSYNLSNSSHASSLLNPYSVPYKISIWRPGSEYFLRYLSTFDWFFCFTSTSVKCDNNLSASDTAE